MLRKYLSLAALLCLAAPAAAQEPAGPLRVFIDCTMHCDLDFFRTEIGWVDYMRDRADADVHVLLTQRSTAGGGREYTLTFIGRERFAGMADTLLYVASSEDSDDLERQGLTRALALGLVPFAAHTPIGQRLTVTAGAPVTRAAAEMPVHDPWNFWTFRLSLSGELSGQSTQRDRELYGEVSANRTTEHWKLDTEVYGRYEEERFEYMLDSVPQTTVSVEKNYGINALVVRSISPHISVGAVTGVSSATFGNTSLALRFTPAVEYNFFPYSESTRRQFTVRYAAGVRAYDYREETIYGLTRETRPVHSLFAGFGTVQPWGEIDVGASFAQYLHDPGFYNLEVGGGLNEIRLYKGFSFSVWGQYELVRDQLHLPGRDLSEEEILLRQRDVKTDYRYNIDLGINYRFGSIFNNVVNPRFSNGSM